MKKKKPEILIELFAPDKSGTISPVSKDGSGKEAYFLWKTQIDRIFRVLRGEDIRGKAAFFLPGEPPPADEKAQRLGLLFLRTDQLSKPSDFFWKLADSDTKNNIRPISKGQNQEIELPYIPILSIGAEDILSLFEEDTEEHFNFHGYLGKEIDPRAKFLDSSIWHRYVSLQECPSGEDDFETRLKETLRDMIDCFENGIYQTVAAKSSLEFHLRMLRESFIARLGEKGHYKVVTPFKFHSETRMKKIAGEQLAFFKKKWNKASLLESVRWRFLMIDDYADAPISEPEPKPPGKTKKNSDIISKKAWIEHLLPAFKKRITIDFPEEGDSEESARRDIIRKSLDRMRNTSYDILLLDYLLGERAESASKTIESGREYGYEFLLRLIKDNYNDNFSYRRGPYGMYWIFPISSFPFALSDKLKQLGISNFTELWHLDGGGDPISTPFLFQYNLLKFMKRQVMECLLDADGLTNFLRPLNSIGEIEIWAEAVSKKLEYLNLQSLILENEANDSEFADSVYEVVAGDFQPFIHQFRELLEILSAGIRNFSALQEFEAKWEELKNLVEMNSNNYTEFTEFLQDKFDKTIYASQKEIKAEINQCSSRRLILSGRQLFSLPEEIDKNPNIRELWLTGNRLESLSETISNLFNLEKIYLTHNAFIRFPKELSSLKRLKHIDIRHNPLPGMINKLATTNKEVKQMIDEAEKQGDRDKIPEQIKFIRAMIAQDNLDTAIMHFRDINDKSSIDKKTEIRDTLVNLLNNLTRLKRNITNGIVSQSEYQISYNGLIYSLNSTLSEFEKEIESSTRTE